MIGKKVTVKVDRPMGSYHPEHKDIFYPINASPSFGRSPLQMEGSTDLDSEQKKKPCPSAFVMRM